MSKTKPLPTAIARKVAVQAEADPRTVQRVVQGLPVRPLVGERIRRVLASMGLVAALLLVACSSSGDGAHASYPDASPPRRGSQATETSRSVGTKVDAILADAGSGSDAVAVASDTLPPTPDVLTAVIPDAQAPDLTPVSPDALPVDTKRATDTQTIPTCRWSNKASGQTADVYLAEGGERCGTYNTMTCYAGCVAMSVDVGTVGKLTPPRQAIDIPTTGCRAYLVLGDAAVEAPGLCFPDVEACAKACQ